MTIREVLSAIGRRWYMPLVALLVGVLLLMLFVRDGGVYTTKTVVTFMLPDTSSLSESNGLHDYSIITFARAVAAVVNNGKAPVSYSTSQAPYYGAGIRQGVLIDVPSDGNQWYASYTRAEIDVQIVGRTREWVAQRQSKIVNQIIMSARSEQAAVTSDTSSYISAEVVPLTLNIGRVSPTRSAQLAALVAMALAVVIVGAWAAVQVDRRLARRRTSSNVAVHPLHDRNTRKSTT